VPSNGSSPQQVVEQIHAERAQLASAVEALRGELAEATDIASKLRPKLPLLAAGALGAGFVLSGGIGATARLRHRRGREGQTKAAGGRYRVVEK
jgi:hypothetical protein